MIFYLICLYFSMVDGIVNVTNTTTTDLPILEIVRYIPIFILMAVTILYMGFRCFCENH